jgi:polysaccharide deacetylase family protein (PEP-CTERM system associated)
MNDRSVILLTFDVEDWFQVENFRQCIPFYSWPACELRIENNVHAILDLLDSIKLNNPSNSNNPTNPINSTNPSNSSNSSNPQHRTTSPSLCAMRSAPCGTLKATFFVLGWLAERLPHLVLEIQKRGHEIASHGYFHKLCSEQSPDDLRMDLVQSKRLLEDITGCPVYGYRAPSFSVNYDILKIVKESGYLYDSSFNSFKINKRYGQIGHGINNDTNGLYIKISDRFYELPISNLMIGKQIIPWGGGGYFRLIPLPIFRQGVEKIIRKDGAYLFYMHPWEIDPEQPRVKEVGFFYRFRHYINLTKTRNKLSYFLEELIGYRFQTCYDYLIGKNRNTESPYIPCLKNTIT